MMPRTPPTCLAICAMLVPKHDTAGAKAHATIRMRLAVQASWDSKPMGNALPPELPEGYLQQVKEVLDHLYDYPYLQNHQWARPFTDDGLTSQQAGQQLRRRFVDAIDTLNPDRVIFFREPEARMYNLLHLYYVEGFSIAELIDELNLSRRQIYRDLKRGQITVAKLLYAQDKAPAKSNEPPLSLSDVTSLEQELSQLQYEFNLVDMCELMRNAISSVMPLCRQKGIQFRSSVPSRAIQISTDKAIAEQVLVNILSQIIVQIAPASIDVSLEQTMDAPIINLTFPQTPAQAIDFSTLSELTKQLDWSVRHSTQDARQIVSVLPQASTHTIMVIDDNQALLQLLQRYLSNHRCQVLTVPNGEKGWSLLQETVPDALIMDVMMPELDGWELLQRIRSNPVTQDIPVVVCTVFNNAELAYALGATYFLHKPVDQGMISHALKRIGVI